MYLCFFRVPSVKAVITTGEGKFYSNGLDVEYLLSSTTEKRLELLSDTQKLMRRVLTFPAVTIAAINGNIVSPSFFGGRKSP